MREDRAQDLVQCGGQTEYVFDSDAVLTARSFNHTRNHFA